MPLSRTVLEVAPSGLAAQVASSTQIKLSWNANPRAGLYRLYRGSTLIYASAAPSFSDTGLTASTLYSYQVSCVGADAQEGPKSSVVSGTTLPVATDNIPNQFTFADIPNQPTSTVVTSSPITISGLSASLSITLNATGGTIDKNGSGSFASSQSVQNGDTVRARVTTSPSNATPVDCVVTAVPSGITDTFTATTVTGSQAGSSEAVFPTDFKFTSTRTATEVFAFGQVFAPGDVPAGQFVISDLATFQCTPLNYWPDGSLKFGVIAGRKSVTANTQTTITLDKTATPPGGVALTESNLSALSPSVSVQIGSHGTVTLASLLGLTSTGAKGSSGKVRTFISGPQMAEHHYRANVGSHEHLAVWFYVRHWANSAIEVEIVVENSYAKVSSPADVTYTAVITINGTTRYNGSVTHFQRTRWRTIHWYDGTDGNTDFQRVIPQHNSTYIKATGVFPNYGGNPVQTIIRNTWGQALAAMTMGNNGTNYNLGGGGSRPNIGLLPTWDADYVNTGNSTAYKAMLHNECAWMSWPMHARDENTGRPIALSNFPNTTFLPRTSSTGDELGYTGSANPRSVYGDTLAHLPAAGFAAYAITGRFCDLDEMAMWSNYAHLSLGDTSRGGAQGLLKVGDIEARGLGWGLRQRAMLVSLWPDSLAAADNLIRSDNIASLQYVLAHWEANYLANNLGVLSQFYGTSAYQGQSGYSVTDVPWAMWQQHYVTSVVGHMYDQQLPLNTAAKASLIVIRDFFYKSIVGMLGTDDFNYRWAGNYVYNLGTVLTSSTATFFTSWAAVFASELAKGHVTTTTANIGDSILGSFTTDPESMWAYLQPALAYAVKHGADGSVAANRRLKSASNWATLATESGGGSGGGYASAAGWWVDPPSAPAWFTALPSSQWGTVAAGGTINAVIQVPMPHSILSTEASSSICNAWVGGWVDPDRREYGLCANGGHGDYAGNENYAISLRAKTPAWRRLSDSTPNAYMPPNDGSSGPNTFNEGNGLYQDGRPRAMHNTFQTYGNRRVWMPAQNSVTSAGGGMYNRVVSYNRDFPALLAADDRRMFGGAGSALAWTLSDLGPWALHGSTANVNGTGEKFGNAVYDPSDGYVYGLGGSAANNCLYWRVGTGAKGTTLGSNSGRMGLNLPIGNFGTWAVCLPHIGTLGVICCGDAWTSSICILDCSKIGQADAWTTIPAGQISGTGYYYAPDDVTYKTGGGGGAYHALSRQILVGDPRYLGGQIYKLVHPNVTTVAGLLAGSWAWSTVSPSGATPATEATGTSSAAFSKWNIIPDMGDNRAALVFVGRTVGPVYVLPIPVGGL